METISILGIDISKLKFNVALIIDNKCFNKVFDNNVAGFKNLFIWLEEKKSLNVHACMEATGYYSYALAEYFYENKINVSLVNPMRIKGFAQSQLIRTKNDKIDAKIIAQFCLSMRPSLWKPLPKNVKALQAFVKRLDALIDLQNQEENRLESSEPEIIDSVKSMLAVIYAQIAQIKKQIHTHLNQDEILHKQKDLLESIKGLGERTISRILAFIEVSTFKSAKQVAAYVGLNPKQYQSGSSVKGRTRLSKAGNAELRHALYFPAIVAMRYNPAIKAFSERLRKAGKPPMVVICASMRKLLHIIYGVLKSGKPFALTTVRAI